MFNIIGHRNWFFLLSALIIVPGTVALIIWGLRPGIDFTGGSVLELRIAQNPLPAQVREVMAQQGLPDSSVVTTQDATGNISYVIRTRTIDTPKKQQIVQTLQTAFGNVTEDRFESVGPVIGTETTQKAILSVAFASLAILAYLSWAFRQVPKPWRYGACAVLALLHDALLVLGVWSILGRFLGFEVDSLFVTAVLTVVGFSVHDTIVVFDRVRENVGRFPGEPFERVVNFSVNQTLDRSVMTSLTTLFTLSALLLLGGSTIHNFVLALLIGIASGTYSSIFNASCLLVTWENGDIDRGWRRLTGRGHQAVPAAA